MKKIRFTNFRVFEVFKIKYFLKKKNSTKVVDPEIKFNFFIIIYISPPSFFFGIP